MDEWIHVVNFDDHGAFLDVDARPAAPRTDSHRSHATDDASRLLVAEGASAPAPASSSSSSSSSLSSLLQHSEELSGHHERSLPLPPSFEAFLAVPSALLVAPAMRSATECATLFDIAQLATEMDVILEAVLDQLQDRHTIETTLATLEQRSASATASLDTTLVVLQRQARDLNVENLVASLSRMQQCLNELDELRYLLAQHIETNHQLRQTLLDDAHCAATDNRVLALTTIMQVEQELIHRIGQLLSPEPSFTMSSLPVPALRQLSASAARVCWPMTASSSSMASVSASATPPPSETFGRASGDVRLSSPTSSSVASQRPSVGSQRLDSQGAQSRSHSPVVSSSASFSSSASSHTTQTSSQ
ncbi:hypothetical protein PINS_up002558 [Pythium insidiosum]|nr:hypothetical protein PINS_up002558 [Pythium insidiosum]